MPPHPLQAQLLGTRGAASAQDTSTCLCRAGGPCSGQCITACPQQKYTGDLDSAPSGASCGLQAEPSQSSSWGQSCTCYGVNVACGSLALAGLPSAAGTLTPLAAGPGPCPSLTAVHGPRQVRDPLVYVGRLAQEVSEAVVQRQRPPDAQHCTAAELINRTGHPKSSRTPGLTQRGSMLLQIAAERPSMHSRTLQCNAQLSSTVVDMGLWPATLCPSSCLQDCARALAWCHAQQK